MNPLRHQTSSFLLRLNAKGFVPPLLDFLNVFYSNGTASPGAERTRLFPGWALPWNYQRLAEKRSLSKILSIFQAPSNYSYHAHLQGKRAELRRKYYLT